MTRPARHGGSRLLPAGELFSSHTTGYFFDQNRASDDMEDHDDAESTYSYASTISLEYLYDDDIGEMRMHAAHGDPYGAPEFSRKVLDLRRGPSANSFKAW